MIDRITIAKHTNNLCNALFAASEAVAERDDPRWAWNPEDAEFSDEANRLSEQAQDILGYCVFEFPHELRQLGLVPTFGPKPTLDNFNFGTIRYALTTMFPESGDQYPGR